jgi:hypothetical protein
MERCSLQFAIPELDAKRLGHISYEEKSKGTSDKCKTTLKDFTLDNLFALPKAGLYVISLICSFVRIQYPIETSRKQH